MKKTLFTAEHDQNETLYIFCLIATLLVFSAAEVSFTIISMEIIRPVLVEKKSALLSQGFSILNDENSVPVWKSNESLGCGMAPSTKIGTTT